jgi:isoleucine--tRNA ligase
MYDFFTMYAEVDGWEFDGELIDPLSGQPVCTSLSSTETASAHRESRSSTTGDTAELAALKQSSYLPDVDNLNSRARADVSEDEATIGAVTNPLDIWIVSRLHELVAEVERQMDAYNIPDALSPILPFLDDASNWYVRRSRRRFWKSEDDGDKSDAYRTLHYVLVRLSYLLAPFTPFLAEELYHNLTGDDESIHLKDWLPAGAVDEQVLKDMSLTRVFIENGLSKRMDTNDEFGSIKVRQPLASASYNLKHKLDDFYEQIMKEELNVKDVKQVYDLKGKIMGTEVDKNITPELKREGLMREVIRHVQSARKKAGLQVDDRIVLHLAVGAEPASASQSVALSQAQPASDIAAQLRQALAEHADTIASETLATMAPEHLTDALYQTTATVDGAELQISLAKA